MRTDDQTGRHDEANSPFPQTQPISIAQTKSFNNVYKKNHSYYDNQIQPTISTRG